MQRTTPRADAALVFGGALLLFSITATGFEARVTDLSALRVLNGEVPYRDFWTMYAPGSFSALALAFAVFGRELLVSNLLGIATSAAAVAAFYRLAKTTCGALPAAGLAALVAVAFLGTGYADGFTSYPPALLLILLGAHRASVRSHLPGSAWAVAPGLYLGAAALFKHDVAAYAALALGGAMIATRFQAGRTRAWLPTVVFASVFSGLLAAAAGILVALGAGRAAWIDLVQFPLTDFRYVRGEYFPLVPYIRASLVETVREFIGWGICNIPLLALVIGLVAFRHRRRLKNPPQMFIVVFGFLEFWLHWGAAHVQINTNAISLTAWGALVGSVSLRDLRTTAPGRFWMATAGVALWAACFAGEPAYRAATSASGQSEWLELPHLRGIRAPHESAESMRALAAAMASEGDADARLLFLSYRNDVHIFAESTPFWLSARRPAVGYHELHPGVTDTEAIQRRMLSQLAAGRAPIVVREHRFTDDTGLDAVKAAMLQHVRVGSALIDQWVEAHYEQGSMFGSYELMVRANQAP